MKNESINFLLIMISYFTIGLLLSQTYIQNQRFKVMNDSINRLIMIEIITEEQFSILSDKVKQLERNNNRISLK